MLESVIQTMKYRHMCSVVPDVVCDKRIIEGTDQTEIMKGLAQKRHLEKCSEKCVTFVMLPYRIFVTCFKPFKSKGY